MSDAGELSPIPPLPPLLLPRPRRISPGEGGATPEVAATRIAPEAQLRFGGHEAYTLRLDGAGATITAWSEAGARHAERTLTQLRAQYGSALPAMTIEDGPAFATRGVMLDISRDRVPTMGQFFETVDLLSALKFNHLQLYTEHTFAYAGHEAAWAGWSPITPAEARELDIYCGRRGIELAANQNCFGHLSKWLGLPEYAHLAETHGEWVFENAGERFNRAGPFSLCPVDPASSAFVDDLLSQLLPCFSGALANIGCDETFDVGFGRSKEAVERRGRAAVYFDFVRSICQTVRRLGKRPMFWADIALSHPDSVSMIPEDMICLAWDYEPDARFAQWCGTLRSAGREAWVCPGTSSWRSITGRTSERRGNLLAAARDGAAGGATGLLVTDWGDSGHHQQWPIALAGIAEAADAAWRGDEIPGYDSRGASLHIFGDRTLETGPWLDALGDLDEPLRRIGGRVGEGQVPARLRNSTVLFNDLFMPLGPGGDERLRRGTLGVPTAMWHEARARLDDLEARRPRSAHSTIVAETGHTLAVARLAIDRATWRRTGGASSVEGRRLAARMRELIEEHRALWLARCREGGLEDSCRHYRRIAEEMEA